MMRFAIGIVVLLSAIGLAQQPPKRPKITGIDHVDFYTTSPEATRKFYMGVLSLAASNGSPSPIEPGQITRFMVGTQWVGYSAAPDPKFTNRMDHIAFLTNSCAAMRRYLAENGVKVPKDVTSSNGFLRFMVDDPEGNRIEFVEKQIKSGLVTLEAYAGGSVDPVSRRLIHVGFIVHDRAAEDHFYKDILGFHLYWHGGMKPDQTDWVAMQVPDGTDWVEYMLNQPTNPDLHLSGIMNHISLGVRDMKTTQAKLEAHGWKPHGDEHAQMGKDGKWQLNLYDPDQTRIELMEFTPSEKPCCSEFQGKHPSETE